MKLRGVLWVLAIAIPTLLCCSATCEAQWKPFSQPSQKPLRLLGHGWSAGYHWRNPGYDSSYYNPYSHHNSHLRSNSASGQTRSAGFSHSLQGHSNDQLVTPNVPVIDAEFRAREELNDNSSQKTEGANPPDGANSSEDTEQRNSIQELDKPKPTRKQKSVMEEALPFDLD